MHRTYVPLPVGACREILRTAMPTMTPLRPPPPSLTINIQQRVHRARRTVITLVITLVALIGVLLVLGENGTVQHVDDWSRQPQSTTTWATPLADWMKAHPGNPLDIPTP